MKKALVKSLLEHCLLPYYVTLTVQWGQVVLTSCCAKNSITSLLELKIYAYESPSNIKYPEPVASILLYLAGQQHFANLEKQQLKGEFLLGSVHRSMLCWSKRSKAKKNKKILCTSQEIVKPNIPLQTSNVNWTRRAAKQQFTAQWRLFTLLYVRKLCISGLQGPGS